MNNEKNVVSLQRKRDEEQRIKEILMDVSVPDSLEARIHQRVKRSDSHRPKSWLAAAVSLIVAIGLPAIWGLTISLNEPSLSDVLLQHTRDEMNHLETGYQKPFQTKWVLAQLNIEQSDSVEISYAGRCSIGNHLGQHLVVQGQAGPVTVLYLPKLDSKVEHFNDERFHGLVAPTDKGSLAVIGESAEPLDATWERIQTELDL